VVLLNFRMHPSYARVQQQERPSSSRHKTTYSTRPMGSIMVLPSPFLYIFSVRLLVSRPSKLQHPFDTSHYCTVTYHAAVVHSFYLILAFPLCPYIYLIYSPSPAPPRSPIMIRNLDIADWQRAYIYKTALLHVEEGIVHSLIKQFFLLSSPFLLACVLVRFGNRLVEPLSTRSRPAFRAWFISVDRDTHIHTLPFPS
jgi:hypothetical protein